MIDSYFSFAYGDRRGLNGFNPQLAEQDRSAYDIDNGVHGTDLMKMHVLHRNAMNFSFRLRDFLKYSKGEFLNGLFKPGMLNELSNILVRSVIMMMVMRMSMVVTMTMAVIMHMSVRMIMLVLLMYVLMAVTMTVTLIMHMFVLIAVTMFMIVCMRLIVLMVMSVSMLMVMRLRAAIFQQHIEFGGSDAVFVDLPPFQFIFLIHLKLFQFFPKLAGISSRIDQCADEHVSADAGKTVKV